MKYITVKTMAASALMLALSSAPAFAQSVDLTISGNGASSTNHITVTDTQTTSVTQSNSTEIMNGVQASSSSGGNQMSGNTGGTSSLTTGDVSTTVSVTNTAGNNVANPGCGCAQPGSLMVDISGNGKKSNNTSTTTMGSTSSLGQVNQTGFMNMLKVSSSSGKNKIKNSTGTGSSLITGGGMTTVTVQNTAGQNLYGVPAI